MDKIFVAYENAKENAIKGDFSDRLHSRYTVTLLFTIAILIGVQQYEGNAITCWLPNELNGDQTDYAHQLCWVNNTYYFPNVDDADIFPSSSKFTVHYYQFILFILLGQALVFMAPTALWNYLSASSGGYIKKLLDQTQKSTATESILKKQKEYKAKTKSGEGEDTSSLLEEQFNEEFKKNFKMLSKQIDLEKKPKSKSYASSSSYHASSVLNSADRQPLMKTVGFDDSVLKDSIDDDEYKKTITDVDTENIEHKGIYKKSSKSFSKVLSRMKPKLGLQNLVAYYMFLKFLNFVNVITQILLLHYLVFDRSFITYGADFMAKIYQSENPFFLSKIFPIISFCNFYVHQNLRQIHWNTAQCILSINIFIEKFYVIIWFWYLLLLIINLLNIFSWCIELKGESKLSFLIKYLNIYKAMHRAKTETNHHQQQQSEKLSSFMQGHTHKSPFEQQTKVEYSSKIERNQADSFYAYLKIDGVLMLHMIKNVAGEIIFLDLLNVLWEDHQSIEKAKFGGEESRGANFEPKNLDTEKVIAIEEEA